MEMILSLTVMLVAADWEGVRITVGLEDADIIGDDNRALQAAVDYVASLGGGVVEIGEGEFLMEDSLHLRSNVTLIGKGEMTILVKSDGFQSRLILDGDYGEEQITVADPSGFDVGMGVTILDDRSGGFHTTVATIIAAKGNTFRINKPLQADYLVSANARAQITFPIISGYYVENVRIEGISIDGDKETNPPITGCRGAGIFLYRAKNVHISNCVVRDYNGDGVSFQQSEDIVVENCEVTDNDGYGFHPGSGSKRPILRGNKSYRNSIGIFVCWRVKHGLFERNEICDNSKMGISIGHKDTDNVFRDNLIARNGLYGIYFRNESEPMGAHRNLIEGNEILDNGSEDRGYGIYIDGETHDITVVGNTIGGSPYGVFIGPKADRVIVRGNIFKGLSAEPIHQESTDSKVEAVDNRIQ
jgi:parallel beta-helix repeat protein